MKKVSYWDCLKSGWSPLSGIGRRIYLLLVVLCVAQFAHSQCEPISSDVKSAGFQATVTSFTRNSVKIKLARIGDLPSLEVLGFDVRFDLQNVEFTCSTTVEILNQDTDGQVVENNFQVELGSRVNHTVSIKLLQDVCNLKTLTEEVIVIELKNVAFPNSGTSPGLESDGVGSSSATELDFTEGPSASRVDGTLDTEDLDGGLTTVVDIDIPFQQEGDTFGFALISHPTPTIGSHEEMSDDNFFMKALISHSSSTHLIPLEMKCYPNPAIGGKLTIDFGNSAIAKIEVLSADGKIVHQCEVNYQSALPLDLSFLPHGNYCLRMLTNENRSLVQKIILQ